MANETDHTRPSDEPDGRLLEIDRLGRKAGAALRNPAPEAGEELISQLASRRRATQRGLAIGGVAVVLLTGTLVAISRRDNPESPDRGVAQPTATTAPPTTPAPLSPQDIADAAVPGPEDLIPGVGNGERQIVDHSFASVAGIPECAAYPSAFVEQSVPYAARIYVTNPKPLRYAGFKSFIFPDEAAAITFMDGLKSPGYEDCAAAATESAWNEASNGTVIPEITPIVSGAVDTTGADDAIVLTTNTDFPVESGFPDDTWVSVYARVANGVVTVDLTGPGSGTNPALVEIAPIAAIKSLTAALALS